MTKMIKLTWDSQSAYIRHDRIDAILPPVMHTLGTRVYFRTAFDATIQCVVRETPDKVFALITAAQEEEERENAAARIAEEARRSTPNPAYPVFWYHTSDSRDVMLQAAVLSVNDEGGVLYDDGRCFIAAPYSDCAEGVRITGGALTTDQVRVALDWLSDADHDWEKPIDRATLLDASARAEKEAADAEPWTVEEEDGAE